MYGCLGFVHRRALAQGDRVGIHKRSECGTESKVGNECE